MSLQEDQERLYRAAGNGDIDDVKELLKIEGIDINWGGNGAWAQRTALHMAAWNGHKAMVELLIDSGASVEARDKHKDTALHKAARNGHAEIADVLVSRGKAQLDPRNEKNMTPLHKGAEHGHKDVVETLIDLGASTSLVDDRKWGVLRIAAENDKADVVDLLIARGAAEGEVEIPDFFRQPSKIESVRIAEIKALDPSEMLQVKEDEEREEGAFEMEAPKINYRRKSALGHESKADPVSEAAAAAAAASAKSSLSGSGSGSADDA